MANSNTLTPNEYSAVFAILLHSQYNGDLGEVMSRFTPEALSNAEQGFYKLLVHSIVGSYHSGQELIETGSTVEVDDTTYDVVILSRGKGRSPVSPWNITRQDGE